MDTKEKIIKYAQNRFYNEGFIKISIEEIARELSISKNTIYKLFQNKDDLLLVIIQDSMNHASEKINNILNSQNNSVNKLADFLKILINIITGFSDKFISDMRNYKPEIWQHIDEKRKIFLFGNLNKLIKQGIKEKLINDYPEDLILTIIVSALRSVLNPQFIMTVNYSRTEIINYTFLIITNGILTDKGKKLFNKINIKDETDNIHRSNPDIFRMQR